MGASSRSFDVPMPQDDTGVSGKSAKIVNLRAFDIATARQRVRELAPDLLTRAFPAPSRHQLCKDAAKRIGVSPDAVLDLMTMEPVKPDVLALCLAARVYSDRHGKQHPIAQFIMQIMGAA